LPIHPRNLRRSFDTRCKRSGVRLIRLQDTRRTCASLLRELDVHPRVAMQILLHSRISLTMDIYTDVPDPATRDALGKLGNWLDQADDPTPEEDTETQLLPRLRILERTNRSVWRISGRRRFLSVRCTPCRWSWMR
jgi:hypothetical protein